MEDELSNYRAWSYAIADVCNKKYCLTSLTLPSRINNKLSANNLKSVNFLMSHTIHADLRACIIKDNAHASNNLILQNRPKKDEKRRKILENVSKIDSSDIKEYVKAMQNMQSQLHKIDPENTH